MVGTSDDERPRVAAEGDSLDSLLHLKLLDQFPLAFHLVNGRIVTASGDVRPAVVESNALCASTFDLVNELGLSKVPNLHTVLSRRGEIVAIFRQSQIGNLARMAV